MGATNAQKGVENYAEPDSGEGAVTDAETAAEAETHCYHTRCKYWARGGKGGLQSESMDH